METLLEESVCQTFGKQKRRRSTRAAMSELRSELYRIVAKHKPMTITQVHDHAVSLQLVARSRPGYKVISRVLGQMRRNQQIPHDWIVSAFTAGCLSQSQKLQMALAAAQQKDASACTASEFASRIEQDRSCAESRCPGEQKSENEKTHA